MATKTDVTNGCGGGCKGGAASTTSALDEAPIACTLARDDLPAREREMRAVFVALVASEPTASGFRWTFRDEPGVEANVRRIAEREAACCAFARFEVARAPNGITFEASAPANAREALEALQSLPSELAAGDRTLGEALVNAGLIVG